MQWEYQQAVFTWLEESWRLHYFNNEEVRNWDQGQSPTLTDFLNQQGRNGWELISAIPEYELQKRTVGPGYIAGSHLANTMRMFFKRPLP